MGSRTLGAEIGFSFLFCLRVWGSRTLGEQVSWVSVKVVSCNGNSSSSTRGVVVLVVERPGPPAPIYLSISLSLSLSLSIYLFIYLSIYLSI